MSRRRRNKHKDEIKTDESWLIPYADILTLLLALFIVLFSMSSIDAQKFQAMAQALNRAFTGGTGFFDYVYPLPEDSGSAVDDEVDESPEKKYQKQVERLELKNIQKKVNAYIQEKNMEELVETSLTDDGLLLTIRDNVLFPSGSATVREEDIKVAEEISELLVMNPPRNIVISGHTDNVPIRNAQFESNWELSAMRAINFMKILLRNDKLDPAWFSAKGYGEFRPIASNDTEEGKARNRRVEILIVPRTSQSVQ